MQSMVPQRQTPASVKPVMVSLLALHGSGQCWALCRPCAKGRDVNVRHSCVAARCSARDIVGAVQVPHHTASLLPIDVQRPSCSDTEAVCIMTGPETRQFAAWANASGFECVPTALLLHRTAAWPHGPDSFTIWQATASSTPRMLGVDVTTRAIIRCVCMTRGVSTTRHC